MPPASVRDPISEGWMRTGAPVDYQRPLTVHCPRDQKQTTQAEYRVIMGGWAGFGSPWFVRLFLKKSSTKGKLGKRSLWTVCSECGSMLPVDEAAREVATALGQPKGFFH